MINPERKALDVLSGAGAVIFDFDDTIAATARSRWDVLIATAARFGVELTRKAICDVWGRPFDDLIDALLPTVDRDDYVACYRRAMSGTEVQACKGAVELVSVLSHKGVTMDIVSSSSKALILQDLDQLGLTKLFTNVYGQEQSKFHKPDPKVLEDVLKNLSGRTCGRGEIVYIGDSARDFAVADGNKIEFIAVLSGLETREELVRAGVPNERIIEDLTRLLGASTNGRIVPGWPARTAGS